MLPQHAILSQHEIHIMHIQYNGHVRNGLRKAQQ